MSNTSPDDKILQLVRVILDAVDARLAAVRQEFAATVEQMEQRHRQVLDALAAFDRRLHAMQAASAAAPSGTPTLRVAPPATVTTAAPAPAPATVAPASDPSDRIDLTEVARLVQERLGNLRLPSLDERADG